MKAGFIGVIGLPNAGKSSFVNRMVGEKVAIVSSKPQTTRSRIMGMTCTGEGQILWVDSPGWLNRGEGLNKHLMDEFKKTVSESDALAVLVNLDAGSKNAFEPLIQIANESKKKFMLIVTKTDMRPFEHRKYILTEWLSTLVDKSQLIGGRVFHFSSLKPNQEVIAEVKSALLAALPETADYLYSPDLYTTQSQRDLVREIIRERCFENLNDEIPFGLAIQVRKFVEPNARNDEESPSRGQTARPKRAITKIFADLVVSKDNHKPIVIGAKGEMLKKIGTESRLELEKMIDQSVYLQLHVRSEPSWNRSEFWLKEFGYDSGE